MRSGQSMLVPWITSVVISDKIIKNQKINKNGDKHGNRDLILSKNLIDQTRTCVLPSTKTKNLVVGGKCLFN